MNENNTESFDIGQILRAVFSHLPLIVIFVLFFTAVSIYSYITSERIYKIESVLQIDPRDSNVSEDISTAIMGTNSSGLSMQNQVYLYKTRSNMISLIDELSLNVFFLDQNDREAVNLKKLKLKQENELEQQQISFAEEPDGKFSIKLNDEPITPPILPGNLYENDKIILEVAEISFSDDINEIQAFYFNDDYSIDFYRMLISVEDLALLNSVSLWNSGGLMKVSMDTNDVDQGKKIIDTANQIFINQDLQYKSKKAAKAISFLDERIGNISELININNERLYNFQLENVSINVDLEVEGILRDLSQIQKQITEIELKEAEVQGSFTETNPFYQNLRSQKAILITQQNDIEQRIKELPIAQQRYIDLYRDIEITQQLYVELQSKRLNYSIIEASTIGNIRVIDNAYEKIRVSPKISDIIIAFILSSIFAVLASVIKGIFFTPITNPAELSERGIREKIFGVVQFDDGLDSKKEHILEQSIESLIVNLKHDNEDKKIILITSPSPSNGKTFLSESLARQIAKLGKKTLLMDCDFKRGDLHKKFGTDKPPKSTILETIKKGDFSNFRLTEDLFFIPRISKISGSFGWVDSFEFKQLLETAKQEFDYIIIDTAPILAVSDTSLLMSISDIRLLVVRHNLTKINEVKQSIASADQLGLRFNGIIYNAFQKTSGYYGRYTYYGNYNYQYYTDKYLYNSYDYENDEK